MSEEEAIKIMTEIAEDEQAFYNTDIIIQTTAIAKLLDLYQHKKGRVDELKQELLQEKEKNKTLEELLQGRLFELYNYYKDLARSYQANCISKNKITNILGLDSTENEEAILQYIQTLESENARLEDIEDRKVQIEYELVFNKGANSIKDKIKEILYAHEPGVSIYLLKELLNKEE